MPEVGQVVADRRVVRVRRRRRRPDPSRSARAARVSASTSVIRPLSGIQRQVPVRSPAAPRSAGPGPSLSTSTVVRRSTTVRTPMSSTSRRTSAGVRPCRLSARSSRPGAVRRAVVGGQPTEVADVDGTLERHPERFGGHRAQPYAGCRGVRGRAQRARMGPGGRRPGRPVAAMAYDFDLLVLGSGPGGQKAAIAGAKLGRRVGIVERRHMVGGVCINTGTIPSKTLREAVLYVTGLSQREFYGQSYRLKDEITVADLTARTQHVIGREIDVIRSQLARNHVQMLDRDRPASPSRTRWSSPRTTAPSGGSRRRSSSSPSAPGRPDRPPWTSTGARWSTPTRSWTWTTCRRRWSSSAPASSASSTPRCSPRSAPRSPSSSGGTGCSSSATWRSSRR